MRHEYLREEYTCYKHRFSIPQEEIVSSTGAKKQTFITGYFMTYIPPVAANQENLWSF